MIQDTQFLILCPNNVCNVNNVKFHVAEFTDVPTTCPLNVNEFVVSEAERLAYFSPRIGLELEVFFLSRALAVVLLGVEKKFFVEVETSFRCVFFVAVWADVAEFPSYWGWWWWNWIRTHFVALL